MRILILKSLILTILIIISESNISFCQWTIQQSNITIELRDVYFTDANHGWAVGGNETIIATVDGGDNWIVQRTLTIVDSSSRGPTLSRVQFVNNKVGYAVGEGGIILATKDGGSTWTKQESGISYIIKGLSFINPDTGWVSGSDYVYGEKSIAILLHTADGGDTWQRFYEVPVNPPLLPNFFNDVIFTDRFNGWAFENYYMDNFNSTFVHRTMDGGITWKKVGQTNNWPTDRLEMASFDSIWACGLYAVGISFNSGKTWNVNRVMSEFGSVKDIAPLDGKCGWFVLNTVSLTRVCYTENGARTYSVILEEPRTFPFIWALSAVGRELLWAVGDSGLVMHHKGIISSIEENSILKVLEYFSLSQNYPNPFNPVTTIRFDLPGVSDVKLTIYNIIGQEVATLVNGQLNAGIHQVKWDASMYSSGIYICRLEAGSFHKAMKITLIK